MEKKTILIIDDAFLNREMLRDILCHQYNILEASNGAEGLEILEQNMDKVCVILLDCTMPVMNGIEVLGVLSARNVLDSIPVIMISSETDPKIIDKTYELGAQDYIMRPFMPTVVKRRVANTILLYQEKNKLYENIFYQMSKNEKSSSLMVTILSQVVEFRNTESGLHIQHVRYATEAILQALNQLFPDKYDFSYEQIEDIGIASSLHDIGKISIPDEILNKPGRYTAEEFKIMQSHAELGANMLKQIVQYKNEPLVKYAIDIAYCHHEKWDGAGYPRGLKGNEIPIWAQAVSIADCYDALTADRCYKKAYPHEKAMQMLIDGECGGFNPDIIAALNYIKNKLKECVESDFESFIIQYGTQKTMARFQLDNKDIGVSSIERERNKLTMLSSFCDEIVFEYNIKKKMLYSDEYGRKRFNISLTIKEPFANENILNMIGMENAERLRTTITNSFEGDHKGRIILNGVKYKGKEYSFLICFGVLFKKDKPESIILKAIENKEDC